MKRDSSHESTAGAKLSVDANRGLVAWRHAQWSAPSTYTDSTLGWYALVWEVTTPRRAFATDPDFEREVGYLYRRNRLGESLDGEVTPA